MVKLPASINLMGQEIPITRSPLKSCYAQFDSEKMSIDIDVGCPDHMIWPALMHEMVHAVLEISGLTNLFELSIEEAICRAMENLASVVELPKAKK